VYDSHRISVRRHDMTRALEEVLREVSKLPEAEQDADHRAGRTKPVDPDKM
jgi:hypothetical protein